MVPRNARRRRCAARRSSTRRYEEFAERGLHGASTEEIARRAGISQPYVFRLFGTKKELYRAVVARCFRETLEMFQRAAEGLRGRGGAGGDGGGLRSRADGRRRSAPRSDAGVRGLRRPGDAPGRPGRATATSSPTPSVSRACRQAEVTRFFANGMLLNVFASMGQFGDDAEPWAQRLLEGCKQKRLNRRLFFGRR